MGVAVAQSRGIAVTCDVAIPSRVEVLTRYRRLRAISRRHHSEILKFLAPDAILHHGRRLGLAHGRTLVLENMDDMNLAVDLAIHTAPAGRSRAIDRYARSARLAPGSDESLVLEAMHNARFAIISVERRHGVAGVTVKDLFRGLDLWLVDESLEKSVPDGWVMATRLYTPDDFAMTAGVIVPVDGELLEDAIREVPQLLRKPAEQAVDDRRLAEAIYRIALETGVLDQVAYEEPVLEAG
jgi:hypothetical protein